MLFFSCVVSILMYREIYHAQRWHTEFQSVMMESTVGRIFLNDFVTFSHLSICDALGKVVNFFMKVSYNFTRVLSEFRNTKCRNVTQ